MSGIFPNSPDGAIPPSADPGNPIAAYPPVTPPVSTAALYYSNGCDVRLRPEVLNALISEIEATVDQANVAYDPARRENMEIAIRYLIQRGWPRGAVATGGPSNYTATLDPPAVGYNDHMTLTIVPAVDNQGAVQININARGLVPIKRNDGLPLESGDMLQGKPAIIAFYTDSFYLVGLAASQVPIVIKGAVDIWIRTDGNDSTGDGSANDPTKAFRTIEGAWQRVGARYATTPLFTMNMRLGIPGTYEGASLGPFGGRVNLIGDTTNRAGYRLQSKLSGSLGFNLGIGSMNQFVVSGVTFVRDMPPPYQSAALWTVNSIVVADECVFESTVGNVNSSFITVNGGIVRCAGENISFYGRGMTLGNIIKCDLGGVWSGGGDGSPNTNFHFSECVSSVSFEARALSVMQWGWASIFENNCSGVQYRVEQNSIINMMGQPTPGDVAGASATGGQFIP